MGHAGCACCQFRGRPPRPVVCEGGLVPSIVRQRPAAWPGQAVVVTRRPVAVPSRGMACPATRLCTRQPSGAAESASVVAGRTRAGGEARGGRARPIGPWVGVLGSVLAILVLRLLVSIRQVLVVVCGASGVGVGRSEGAPGTCRVAVA